MRLLFRHLRSLGAPVVLLALVVGLVTAAAVAAPRAVDRTATKDLRERLSQMSPVTRDLTSSRIGPVPIDPPEGQPLDGLRDDLGRIRAEMPPVLADTLTDSGFVLRTRPTVGLLPASPIRSLEFVALSDTDAALIVEGRLPKRLPTRDGPPHHEIALSTATAERLGLKVGDEVELAVDESMDFSFAGLRAAAGTTVTLVGTFEATDPAADIWRHAESILLPFVFDDGNSPVQVRGAALVDPSYFSGTANVVEVQTWLSFDPDAVRLDNAEEVHAALRKVASGSFNLSTSEIPDYYTSLRFASRASETIEAALARRDVAAAVLAVAAAGPVGVALVVLAIGILLLRLRQQRIVVMLAARGASPTQLRGALALVGLVVGVPAAGLGVALATWGVVAPGAPSAWWIGLLLGLAPAVALAATAPVGRAAPRQPGPESVRRRGTLRILGELAVVLLAGACVLALLQGGSADRVDWLLVAAPLFLGLVVVVVVLRLTEAVLLGLAALGRRRSGLVGFVGPSRARREAGDAAATVAVLVLGSSLAIFSAVVLLTLRAGVRRGVEAAEDAGVEPLVTPDSAAFTGLVEVLAVSGAISIVLVGVALVLGAAVSSESRQRLVATLRVLGTSRRQLASVALWEVVPVMLAGLVAGVLLGVGLPWVIGGLDLMAFTGEDAAPTVLRPPLVVLGIAAAFAVCTLVVRLTAAAVARRAEPAPLFRSTQI